MKLLMKLALLLLIFTLAIPSYCQLVKKRVKNYVLIDADSGLGKVGDKINVYRITGDDVTKVGSVEIVIFARGMTAARVLQEESPGIQLNDFVDSPGTRKILDKLKGPPVDKIENKIILRNKGFALIKGGRSLGNEGDELIVARKIRNTLLEVGIVKIVKFVNDQVAVKIIIEYNPYRISKNDFIKPARTAPSKDDRMDVDYYYYGLFK